MKAMTDTNNLAIWQQVEKTDPKFTKEFSRGGGFKGTATNATWLAKRATETFGPIGIGWGVEIEDESYVDGHEVRADNGAVLGRVVIHKLRARLWYMWNGAKGSVVQFGQTEFIGRNKNGWFTDEEAPKKSLTDATSKCLSLIGFAADVHMGMFDDNKYVNDRNQEEAQKRQQTRAQAPKPEGAPKPEQRVGGQAKQTPAPMPQNGRGPLFSIVDHDGEVIPQPSWGAYLDALGEYLTNAPNDAMACGFVETNYPQLAQHLKACEAEAKRDPSAKEALQKFKITDELLKPYLAPMPG